jgi:hypothetical protein
LFRQESFWKPEKASGVSRIELRLFAVTVPEPRKNLFFGFTDHGLGLSTPNLDQSAPAVRFE